MRRTKIFSAFSLIILCVCMLCVGVIAANGVPEIQTGGVINVPANHIGVTVKGYINCVSENGTFTPSDPADFDSTTDEDGAWQFTEAQLSEMSFDLDGVNTLDQLKNKKVVITFAIDNHSDMPLHAFFKKIIPETEDSLEQEISYSAGQADYLDGTDETDSTLKATFGEILVIGAQTTNNIISLVFSPLKFVETEVVLTFNYTLQMEETAPAESE